MCLSLAISVCEYGTMEPWSKIIADTLIAEFFSQQY